jgi:hypothetical protein
VFPDVETIRSVQAELDIVLEEGVNNIVQLLKNSETGISSGAAKFDEDAFDVKNRQKGRFRRWEHRAEDRVQGDPNSQKGDFSNLISGAMKEKALKSSKLTDKLISQGLLTKDMLTQLKREWEEQKSGKNNDSEQP